MRRILAYFTAYCDKLRGQNLISYLQNQSLKIEYLLIVDNSPIKLLFDIKVPFTIIHKPQNIGISQGLYIAIQWGIKNHYDFLWTFDQDSLPSTNTLSILISEYEYLNNLGIPVGIIAPTILVAENKNILLNGYVKKYKIDWSLPNNEKYSRKELYQCDVVITSGSLINIQAAQNIPPPNPDFFIDGVDWDYCLKMRKQNYYICVTEKVKMLHNFGTYLTTLSNKHSVYTYSALRYYYMNRNHTYIETRLSTHPCYITLSALHRVKILIKKILKIIIYEPNQKSLKIWAACLGFYHGAVGKLGKTWLA